MPKPLTQGEKNRRANIKALKALGRKNATERRRQARANVRDHLARMAERAEIAVGDRAERRAAGIARRDAHNDGLRRQAQERRSFAAFGKAMAAEAANDSQQLPAAA